MKTKFFLFIFAFFFIFSGIFFYKNFENIEIFFQIPFFWNKKVAFNEALYLARSGNFTEAQKILPKNIENENAKIFEIEWDLDFVQNNEKNIILEHYNKSLELQENARIRSKILLLENPEKKDENVNKNSNTSGLQEKPELKKKTEEIKSDQKRREEFLNASGNSENNFKNDLQNIKNALSGQETTEKKDW